MGDEMKQEQVFISHSGPDTPQATAVADRLESGGLRVSLDRRALEPGDTILAFMEQALTESDYCLLLWSRTAAEREWVKIEWQAALYRTVKEARRFLLVGRLEDHPLPSLLAPRLFVDLFPAITPGVDRVIEMCRQDHAAAIATERPVGQPARAEITEAAAGDTIYVTSELFGLTVPLRVQLDSPVAIWIDQLVTNLKLPKQLDHEGIVGLRCRYHLVHDDHRLANDQTFRAQKVVERSILKLELEMTPFAAGTPVEGSLSTARFRSGSSKADYSEAHRTVLAAIARAGLGA